MTITPEMRQASARAGGEPIRLIDPETNEAYYLVKEDVFSRLRSDLDGPSLSDVGILVDKAMSDEDAGDPLLNSYQTLRQ